MLFCSVLCAMFAMHMQGLKEQRQAAVAIRQAGGRVSYFDEEENFPGASWLKWFWGNDIFRIVYAVDLTRASVSDDLLEKLSSLRHLESLELSGTATTDAGLRHIIGLTELKGLSLRRTQITDAGLAS